MNACLRRRTAAAIDHTRGLLGEKLEFRIRSESVEHLLGRQPHDIGEPGFGGGGAEARIDFEAIGGE